jgi:hypothetical protein
MSGIVMPRPSRPLLRVLAALAVGAVAGCSQPQAAPAATAAIPPAGGQEVASADPPQSVITDPTADEKTLSADHPYRDRHGAAKCAEDCTVHEAGYKWAALHTLTDASRCAGRTVAFVDGCRAYADDHR